MKNGDCYCGEFYKNRREGFGMCTYADGCTYDGSWIKDKRSGTGIQWFASGDRYEGEWLDDKKHGYGVLTYSNGETYKGDFHHDQRHGTGKASYNDGSISQGPYWVNDEFTGKNFKPDYDYIGDYCMTLNSHLYAKKHGKGRKIWKDGTNRIYNGEWYGDKMIGQCQAMNNFDGIGTSYSGQVIIDGIKHGMGVFTAANGDVYNGQWDHGKKHGFGSETFAATGEVYTGKWYQGRSMRRGGKGGR